MTQAFAARKPWHLCRVMGCKLRTRSGFIETNPQIRFCGRHMPLAPEVKIRRSRCRSFPKKLAVVVPISDPCLPPPSYCQTSLHCRSMDPPSTCASPLPLRCQAPPSSRSQTRLPYYWLLKVGEHYAMADHSQPSHWRLGERHRVKGVHDIRKARAQLRTIQLLYPEAKLVRFYWERAKRKELGGPLFTAELKGVYDNDLLGKVLESARLMRRVVRFTLTPGAVTIEARKQHELDLVTRMVGHHIRSV